METDKESFILCVQLNRREKINVQHAHNVLDNDLLLHVQLFVTYEVILVSEKFLTRQE